jgi:hypothetical protein
MSIFCCVEFALSFMSRHVVSKEVSKPVSVKRFQVDQASPESSIAALFPSRN